MNEEKIEMFERCFRSGCGTVCMTCNCGLTYYNYMDAGCFEEGELEKLEKNPKAKAVDYSISILECEGRQYADGCDCWHKRALQLLAFIDGHAHAIAEYLTLEKQRKQRAADNSPTVGANR